MIIKNIIKFAFRVRLPYRNKQSPPELSTNSLRLRELSPYMQVELKISFLRLSVEEKPVLCFLRFSFLFLTTDAKKIMRNQ